MVSGSRPRILGGGFAGLALAAAAAMSLSMAVDDPYYSGRPASRKKVRELWPRPHPEGPCSFRATGNKRSRRRQRGKAGR